jgi:transposase
VALANDGLSQAEIAVELNIHRSTVMRIWRKADEAGLLEQKVTAKGRNQYQKGGKGE